MRTSIDTIGVSGDFIPKEKREEFGERILQIFREGGMFTTEELNLCGKKIPLLKDPCKEPYIRSGEFILDAGNYIVPVWYNLFDRHSHEKAKYSIIGGLPGLYCPKGTWGAFNKCFLAAYDLEKQYRKEPSIVMVDKDHEDNSGNLWLNFLFGTEYQSYGTDYWRVFQSRELLNREFSKQDEYKSKQSWPTYIRPISDTQICDLVQIAAAQKGVNKAMKLQKELKASWEYNSRSSQLVVELDDYPEKMSKFLNFDVSNKDIILEFLRQGKWKTSLYEKDFPGDLREFALGCQWAVIDHTEPLFTAMIAEKLDMDFWDVFTCFMPEGRADRSDAYSFDSGKPVNTMEYLNIGANEYLAYFDPDRDELSDPELKKWLKKTAQKFRKKSVKKKMDLWELMELLAWLKDQEIYPFASFIEFCLNDLPNPNVQKYWSLIRKLKKRNDEELDAYPYERYEEVRMLNDLTHNRKLFSALFGFSPFLE